MDLPSLTGSPSRVFVSVDETTGRATVSFFPTDIGTPIALDDDKGAERALALARAIAGKHPGCTVDGPHFHASKPGGPKPRWKRRTS